MTQTPYALRYDFRGGVNNTLLDEMLSDSEASDARNYIPNIGGVNPIKRYGYEAHRAGVASKQVWSIYGGTKNGYYVGLDSGTAADTVIYALSDGSALDTNTEEGIVAPTWTSQAGTDLMANGVIYRKSTNGTSFAAWSGVPTTTVAIESFNNMIFAANDGLYPTTVSWTQPGTIETWSATQALTLATLGDWITGLRAWNSVLWVVLRKKIIGLQGFGATDITVTHQIDGIGGDRGSEGLVATPFGLFVWDRYVGLVRINGEQQIDFPMKRKLASTLASVVYASNIGVHGHYRRDLRCVRYFVGTVSGATPNLRIDYYPEYDTFWLHSLDDFTNGVKAAGVYNDVEYISGDTIEVFKEGTSCQDNGQTLSAYAATKRQPFVSQSASKNARHALITTKMATSANLTYEVFADNATSATQSFTITPAAGVVDTDVGINQECRKIQHKITDANNARNELYSIVETGYVDQDVVS